MKKLTLAFLSLLASLQIGFVALPALAVCKTGPGATALEQLECTKIQEGTSDPSQQLPLFIGNIIKVFMSILGIIMVLLIIYAGFLWMTAGGDDDKVTQAKALIKNSVIGLILILLAYAITGYVINAITTAAKG